jgi:signal transduction histidine kinase
MTRPSAVGTVRAVPFVDRFLDRWRRVPPLAADAGLAAVVGLVTAASIAVADGNDPSERATWWGWALVAVQVVALVWRRRAPVVVATGAGGAMLAYGLANLPDPAIPFPALLAVYSVAAHRPRRVSIVFVAALTVVAGVVLAVDSQTDVADIAVNYFVGVTSWLVGDAARAQRERARLLVERQEGAAARAAADERVRIARDLHDVVAHHISVIAVQAEAAQEVLATSPERAGAAMATVADTARTALGDLRRALGVLRAGPELAPQPGLAALDDLVESVRGAGLGVELRTTGPARPVDGVVGVTAYRIVQEALTNVLRHADAGRACVELAFSRGALVVTVSDDGRGGRSGGADVGHGDGVPGRAGGAAAGSGSGHGIVGMRERVVNIGGDLSAGPDPGGGFTVRARLPLPA